MNVELRDVLTRQAESVDAPVFDADAVVAQGERLVRRRQALGLSAVAAALAITVGVTSLATRGDGSRPEPTEPPDGIPTWTPGTRPLAYGQGQTLHLGERQVDTGLDFLSVDLTDDGAVLTTLDGGIWFTDGGAPERIGTTIGVCCVTGDGWTWRAGRPREWVVTDSSGSLLAWLEFRDRRVDQPELVVYDSSARAFVAREPVVVTGQGSASIVALADRAVFVTESPLGRSPEVPLQRFDLDSGSFEPSTGNDLSAAVRGVPRALAVGPVSNGLVVGAPAPTFGGPPMTETLGVVGSVIEDLHDPDTREWVEMTVPEGSEPQDLWFTQWLDDDSFAATTYIGKPVGDLLVCRISAGRCDVVIEAATWRVDALLPGPDNFGSDLALGRAIEEYRRQQQ